MNIITTVVGFIWSVLAMWSWREHWPCYSLSPLHLVCVAVSLIIVFLFFSEVNLVLFFVVVLFQYALRETVNNCIIHWTKEYGTHYVYLKSVSWFNKRWTWVVYLNILLEASLNVCTLFSSSDYGSKCRQVLKAVKEVTPQTNTHSVCPGPSHPTLWCALLSA